MIQAFASWSHVVDHLYKLNLQAALLAVIVGIICLLGRRWLSSRWRSILWMLVFVRLLIPFGPSATFSLGNVVSASFTTRSVAGNTFATAPSNQKTRLVRPETPVESGPRAQAADIETAAPRVATKSVTTSSRWSVRDMCTAVWLMVAAFLLGRLGWLKIQLSRQLPRLEVICQSELIELAESVASRARLTRVPRLLWGAAECGPAVCGWLFPVLILPRDSAIFQPSQLRAVLLHEFRHIRTADTLLTWLPRVLCATFWFNPLLWHASRKWHEERELSCDEWVIRQIGPDQKRSYLETLVTIATRSSRSPALELTASIVSSFTLLERRIVAMKRLRPPTRTGLIAGSLLTLFAAAIGLTDAAQARNEPATAPDSAPVVSIGTDQDTGAPAGDHPATPKVAPQAKTLNPKVVFAQHVILWEGTEIVTRDQLKERLAKLRATQSVKPFLYHSLGFIWNGVRPGAAEAELNERANQAIGESLNLIGRDQWGFMSFLSRRGSGAVDRIRTEDDLKGNPARSLKGRVVMSEDIGRAAGLGSIEGKSLVATGPVPGAQVVVLPLGEPCVVRLRDGKLRDPQDEIWYETNAQGMFQADPAALPFDPLLLYGDGKYLTFILHESGYRLINGQLAASDATYELLPWTNVTIDARNLKENEQVEIWMTPEGAHEKFPALSIGWVGHGDRPVIVKLPRGKGNATYWKKVNDEWTETDVRHSIQMTADGPTEITLPPAR
ncbi:MAG TPA: M56 family metallopeptidase [Planctomycetaceae bacterium]|jgi:beta-lactamase regulating signal transducer with metallopeptidase domain